MMSYQILLDTYQLFVPEFLYSVTGKEELASGIENWRYIPTDASIFELVSKDMGQNLKETKKKFLEVGCGVPIFSYALKKKYESLLEVHGIELNKEICDYVASTYFRNEVEVEYANASDYEKYEDYDFIYLCTPIKDAEAMNKCLLHILENMKDNAILYLYTTTYYDPSKFSIGCKMERLGNNYLYKMIRN